MNLCRMQNAKTDDLPHINRDFCKKQTMPKTHTVHDSYSFVRFGTVPVVLRTMSCGVYSILLR